MNSNSEANEWSQIQFLLCSDNDEAYEGDEEEVAEHNQTKTLPKADTQVSFSVSPSSSKFSPKKIFLHNVENNKFYPNPPIRNPKKIVGEKRGHPKNR